MIQTPFIRNLVLRSIETRGSRLGPPTVRFPDKIISVQGDDFQVANGMRRFITGVSGFYLSLPANVFGVVSFPNGTSQNMEGGVHEAPPGRYRVQYVDGHERSETMASVSEMTTDGESITLKVVLRYRVSDPITVLRIDRPVETLLEHVGTDVAQYIRTHAHTDIADSSEHNQNSRLLSYFIQRHNRRLPLSRAFSITGIEIKDFTGDNEYVEMRRRQGTEAMRNQLEKQQVENQQQMTLIKAQFKADGEKAMLEHKAALDRKTAEQKAEIEKLEARHEKEMQSILNEVHLREIELDNRRKYLQRRDNEFAQIIEAISRQVASGTPLSSTVMKALTDLLAAYLEGRDAEPVSSDSKPSASSSTAPSANHDKVETLKNTLLDLLNPKK